jgi:transposase
MKSVKKRIVLSSEAVADLQAMVKSDGPQRMVRRAEIILGASRMMTDQEIAEEAGVSRPTVAFWRREFLDGGVERLLKDAHRSGRPKILSAKLKTLVVAAARAQVDPSGKTWSSRRLAESLSPTPISHTTICRTWNKSRGVCAPSKVKFDLDGNQEFFLCVRDVFGLYTSPPDRALVLVAAKSQRRRPNNDRIQDGDFGLLGVEDIFHARTFINRLRGPRELDQHIWDRLGSVVRRKYGEDALQEGWEEPINCGGCGEQEASGSPATDHAVQILTQKSKSEQRQREELVESLNDIIQSGPLYDEKLFSSVVLDKRTRSLVGHRLEKTSMIKLNRRLLVLAYPSEFPEFFAIPSDRFRTSDASSLLWLFRQIESKIILKGPAEDPVANFLDFLKGVDGVRKSELQRRGDLWPMLSIEEAFLEDWKPLYPGLHQLHIITSGSTTRHPKVAQWLADNSYADKPKFQIHPLPAGRDWFAGLTKWFGQLRRLRYHRTMLQRLRILYPFMLQPAGPLRKPHPADRFSATEWWPEYPDDAEFSDGRLVVLGQR